MVRHPPEDDLKGLSNLVCHGIGRAIHLWRLPAIASGIEQTIKHWVGPFDSYFPTLTYRSHAVPKLRKAPPPRYYLFLATYRPTSGNVFYKADWDSTSGRCCAITALVTLTQRNPRQKQTECRFLLRIPRIPHIPAERDVLSPQRGIFIGVMHIFNSIRGFIEGAHLARNLPDANYIRPVV